MLTAFFSVKAGSCSSLSLRPLSGIPQTILSLTSESLKSPKSQVLLGVCSSARYWSKVIPCIWSAEKNVYLSNIIFLLGKKYPSNFVMRTVSVKFASSSWKLFYIYIYIFPVHPNLSHPSGRCTLVVVEERPPTWLWSALSVQQYTIKHYISASFIHSWRKTDAFIFSSSPLAPLAAR